jgi:uncharacterized membrane protein
MWNLPLHPAIVHLPIGVAAVLPLVAVGVALALWRGWLDRRAWTLVVALQAITVAGGLVAMKSGEREEERVEEVVPERVLEAHEEAASVFVAAAAITLVLAASVFAVRRAGAVRGLAAATATATFLVAALAFNVGHAGGELVYRHGAAATYTGSPAAAPAAAGHADDD